MSVSSSWVRFMSRAIASSAGGLLLAACGGSGGPDAEAPASAALVDPPASDATAGAPDDDGESDEGEEEEDTGDAPITKLPAKCSKKGAEMCTPPVKFVKRLCAGFFPDIALAMFAKDTPWTRGYLAANVRAWNASGGASSEDELEFDEEVIVLHHRKASADGIQVSGSGDGYDVLRWDGTCATLGGGELTLKTPPKAKHAMVLWKDLDPAVRAKLLDNETLDEINRERKKECKGVSMGAVSKKCVTLVGKQSDLIVDYIRNGGAVPPPPKLP